MRKATYFALIAATSATAAPAAAQVNQIYNPGFEMGPAINLGNNFTDPNTGHAVGWLDSGGMQPNVVKVDGPGDNAPCQNYGNAGPENDASGTATCANPRHYLDIKNGKNTVYQRFTPKCKGEVRFGASFSTRADSSGVGNIRIRQGSSITSPVLSTTSVNLPRGNSKTDPWQKTAGSISLQAGQTYVFEVAMDDNLNMDDAFVYFSACNDRPDLPDVERPDWTASDSGSGGGIGSGTVSHGGPVVIDLGDAIPLNPKAETCCPPIAAGTLENLFQPQFQSGAGGTYRMFQNQQAWADFNAKMQAWVNMLHAFDPATTEVTIHFRIGDVGPFGTNSTSIGNSVAGTNDVYMTWKAGPTSGPVGSNGFWSNFGLQPNRQYVLHTGTYPNEKSKLKFDGGCLGRMTFGWNAQSNALARSVGNFVVGTGAQRKVIPIEPKLNPAAPVKRRR